MRDEFLVFGRPHIGQAEIDEVVDSLRSGWIGTGPKVRTFESMLSTYLEAAHVRCVSSCTAALFLAMRCLDIGEGDEVIVPAMTFVATANAVEHTGARVVLVDVDPDTGLIDFDAAAAAITPRTKAMSPVHLYGRPIDADRLAEFRDRHGLKIIEDAAHAIGAKWRGRPVGSSGNPTAFSFYPTKNITTIEGGALATDDAEVADRVESLALHGLSTGAWQRFSDSGFKHYLASEVGYKFNMTDVQAAIGIHQLPDLDDWIVRRAHAAAWYDAALANLPVQVPVPPTAEMTHAWHLYAVLLDDDAAMSRDQTLDGLNDRNIGTGVHYTAVHLHPYYRDKYGMRPEDFPVATSMSRRTMSLPLSAHLAERDQADVVSALRELLA